MHDIPLWLNGVYGYIEIFVFCLFVINLSNIKVSFSKLLLMTFCVLLIILPVRIIAGNVFIQFGMGFLIYLLFIWLFTGEISFKVTLYLMICYLISAVVEPVSYLLALNLLGSFNYKLVWFVSGLPHILIIAFITLVIREKKFHGKYESEAF